MKNTIVRFNPRLRLAALTLLAVLLSSAVFAQPAAASQQPAPKANIIIEQKAVRFDLQGESRSWQLEVFNQAGELIFASGVVSQRALEWALADQQEKPLAGGLYAYTLKFWNENNEQASVQRGHIIVNRASHDDRIWVTSNNATGIGSASELIVAGSTDSTVGGARMPETSAPVPARTVSERTQPNPVRESAEPRQVKDNGTINAVGPITGEGIANRIAKFTGANFIEESGIMESAGRVLIGINAGTARLTVADSQTNAIHGKSGVASVTTLTAGVFGEGVCGNCKGVVGEANNGAAAIGVVGESSNGRGVVGVSLAREGVHGASDRGYGVRGATNGGPNVAGVIGRSDGADGIGVVGEAFTGQSTGVLGKGKNFGVRGDSAGGFAVFGQAEGGIGVKGVSDRSHGVIGVSNTSIGASGYSTIQYGVYGQSARPEEVSDFPDNVFKNSQWGVYGVGDFGGVYGGGQDLGVYGQGFIGVRADATSEGGLGLSVNGYGDGRAAHFRGDVDVWGTLTADAFEGNFASKIDHPLDPANKYLNQSFVEAAEMMSVQNGNIVTDANGEAIVTLPEYFQAMSGDFRYQLTVVGQFAQAIVARKIEGNRFTIKTDKPNVEVSWQVTGLRQDAAAKANRKSAEESKPEAERGHYLRPALFNQPEEKSIEWARHPELMKRVKAEREQTRKTRP